MQHEQKVKPIKHKMNFRYFFISKYRMMCNFPKFHLAQI